jgi:hypothetical protein
VAIFVGSTSDDFFIGCAEATLCLVSACYHQEAGAEEANGPARKDVWKQWEATIQNEVIIGFSLACRERFPYNPVDFVGPVSPQVLALGSTACPI